MEYPIGELSRRSGYAVQTLRYYEQIGLMQKPARTAGGQRRYTDEMLKRLLFIRHARDLGFSVEDIRNLLDLSAKPDQSCGSVDSIAASHLNAIDAKITALQNLRREIAQMLGDCAKTRISDCKVISALASG